jgi:hypothetical protein
MDTGGYAVIGQRHRPKTGEPNARPSVRALLRLAAALVDHGTALIVQTGHQRPS